jgi:hypothetical protein
MHDGSTLFAVALLCQTTTSSFFLGHTTLARNTSQLSSRACAFRRRGRCRVLWACLSRTRIAGSPRMGTQPTIPPETPGAQATTMKTKNGQHSKQVPLCLVRSLKAAATLMADREGVSLNHFITLAVAEKISRFQQENSSPPKAKRASKVRGKTE